MVLVVAQELLIDDVKKFVYWLPKLEPHEAYVAYLLIRGKEYRRRTGRRLKDRVVAYEVVYGFDDERWDGVELWRSKLVWKMLRLEAIRWNAPIMNIVRRPGTTEIEDVERVDPEIVAPYIQINPGNIVKALAHVSREGLNSLATLALNGLGKDVLRANYAKPLKHFLGGLAKYTRTVFHVVDADDEKLARSVIDECRATLGYTPARIRTVHGYHVLINLDDLKKRGLVSRYAGKPSKELRSTISRIDKLIGRGDIDMDKALRIANEWLSRRGEPLYYRLLLLSAAARDPETGGRLVEVKTQGLEPVPGTYQRGHYIRFYPEEW